MKKQKFAVIELFAGVGGFRLGLEGDKRNGTFYSAISDYKAKIENPGYFVTGYANQYEPGRKNQFAAKAYKAFYNDDVLQNEDIGKVDYRDIINSIKKRDIDTERLMLVGGFPCQDYSVANGLHTSKGLVGNKGVLWWEIRRLIEELKNIKKQPEILLLENVDRLLVSPAKQRGRDFAIMLYTLSNLGYTVEYKVINATHYGFPQKRKRVFILAYLKTSKLENKSKQHSNISAVFPSSDSKQLEEIDLSLYTEQNVLESLKNLEENFVFKKSPFGNAGIMKGMKVFPFVDSSKIPVDCKTLGSILVKGRTKIPHEFWVQPHELEKWRQCKGAKKIPRVKPNGEPYIFSEGAMSLFDSRKSPSRTIITSEGGRGALRTRHLIKYGKSQRRLLPIELERLNMFPDNITNHSFISSAQRAFLMGNALVVGVVESFRNLIIDKYED